MQRKMKVFAILGVVAILAGCESMSTTEKRTLTGTAIGTAGGAAIGGASGHGWAGAAIGAAAGTAGGYLYDRHKSKGEGD